MVGVGLSMQRQREIDEQLEQVMAEGEDLVAHVPPGKDPVDFMQPDPESLRGIPPYPGASPRRLSSTPAYKGQPFAASWFSTQDAVESVVGFYRDAFSTLQTPNVSHVFSENLGYAAFYEMPDLDGGADVMSGQVHMVTAVHSGSQTYVFVSNSQPTLFLEQAAVLPGGLELPPGALRAQWVDVGEGPIKKKTVFAVVPEISSAEVSSYFNGAFSRNQWVAEPASVEDGLLTLKARRGGDVVTVVLKSESTDVRMLLTIDNIASPPTGAP